MISFVADPRNYQLANNHLFSGLDVHFISEPLLPQINGLGLSVNEPREMNDLSS